MLRLPQFGVESPETVDGVVAALQANAGARVIADHLRHHSNRRSSAEAGSEQLREGAAQGALRSAGHDGLGEEFDRGGELRIGCNARRRQQCCGQRDRQWQGQG